MTRLAALLDDLQLLRQLYGPSLTWSTGALAAVLGSASLFLL